MSRPLRIAVLGAGGRGREAYGRWLLAHPDRARIVAVAEHRESRRAGFVASIPGGAVGYATATELLANLDELELDAAIIALPDQEHVGPAIEFIRRGIPILLEKPAATDPFELERLAAVQTDFGTPVVVGHVLRFTPFWRAVRDVIQSGALGRLMTLEIRENIGYWHFAHSYVRGNWRSASTSSPMVLAKTSHDLDLMRWLADAQPLAVTSAGSLSYFREENAPVGAPEFCVDGCPVAASCPFYAPRYYVDALADVHGVPVTLLTDDTSPEGRVRALAHSDYGRCVFRSANDVADHQQTTVVFPDGLVASLVASAFTPENTRHLTITGTGGQLTGHMDEGSIDVDLFSPTAQLNVPVTATLESVDERGPLRHCHYRMSARAAAAEGDHRGHAGGDDGLAEAFISGLEAGTLASNPDLAFAAALDSHRMAFAAEDARLSGGSVVPGYRRLDAPDLTS